MDVWNGTKEAVNTMKWLTQSHTHPTKRQGELKWSWYVSSPCSTSDTNRFTQVKNPVISQEIGKGDGIMTTTN
jgi:hypothetical protein